MARKTGAKDEPPAAAGDNSAETVNNGDNGGENAGTDQGTEASAEGVTDIPPAAAAEILGEEAPEEDHVTAFDRRMDRLVAIAEDAEFSSGTIVGDLRDIQLDLAKALPKGWGAMSEMERKDFARTCEQKAKVILRKLVQVIAEEDEISVHAKLDGYQAKGDAFKLTLKATIDEETALQLFRLDGHEVVLISADATRFHGQRRDADIPSDRPQFDFASGPAKAPGEITSEKPDYPADDSDLAGEEMKADPLVALGEGERVNIATGKVEKQVGDVDGEPRFEDVREATPEELAAADTAHEEPSAEELDEAARDAGEKAEDEA